ncbi:lipoprotein [Spiroplasma eriocheiris]|uniref:Lipoprotein n=2 Tax=Spiroplasma TaxID=2132 RepID=A0A0H3XKN8_9MOLU|nr:lipoprotein [Spiroplasma eriocheiris]AHF57543.1 hypothetical protein SPE_0414 [Spiroplasma eriocheiris CCTCC M 207170]AKM53999.1 hypothetical protein SERIO_v1c04200 [Spiroplasma eriocheiris]
MKKLLSILGAIGLVATGASNVIACHSSSKDDNNAQNPNDNQKIEQLLSTVQNDITNQFGHTINDRKNLFSMSQLAGGMKPSDFANILGKLTAGQEINNIDVNNKIFNGLKPIVQSINDTLATNKQYSVLFDKIDVNNILNFDIKNSVLTKQAFDAQSVVDAIGVHNAAVKAEIEKEGLAEQLTEVYRVEGSLHLKLQYMKDGKAESINLNIDHYNIYISYNLAALGQLIKIVSNALSEYLKTTIQEVDFTKLDANKFKEFKKLDHQDLNADNQFLNNNVYNILKGTIMQGFSDELTINSYTTNLTKQFGNTTIQSGNNGEWENEYFKFNRVGWKEKEYVTQPLTKYFTKL